MAGANRYFAPDYIWCICRHASLSAATRQTGALSRSFFSSLPVTETNGWNCFFKQGNFFWLSYRIQCVCRSAHFAAIREINGKPGPQHYSCFVLPGKNDVPPAIGPGRVPDQRREASQNIRSPGMVGCHVFACSQQGRADGPLLWPLQQCLARQTQESW